MLKFLKKVVCLVMAAFILGAAVPTFAIEAEQKTIKILAIGNSYSNNATYYVSKIADSMGLSVSVTSLYDDGCPIERHIKWYNENAKEYEFYVDGVNVSSPYKNTMKEVFERDDYDYITVQQSSTNSPDFSTYWTQDKPYLTELYDIIRENEPQAEILIHQTWSHNEITATKGNQYTSKVYDSSLKLFQLIENAYEQAADKLSIDKETGIIPVGRAIQLAKDQYGYFDGYNDGYSTLYPISSSVANAAKHCENGALYADNLSHLNHRGRYIASCVWIEKIFGLDCRTATFYPNGILTEEECVILRNIAHEAVTGEKAYVEGNWRVLPDGDGLKIVHYMGDVNELGTVTIPSAINGKKVTRVDDTTFKYVEGINNLILPGDDTIVYEDGALGSYNILENVWDGTSSKPTKGNGTEESPYLIENGSHLYWTVTNKNQGVYFKLTNDIILNNMIVDAEKGIAYTTEDVNEWYTECESESPTFAGIIDGDYHTIYGLYIDEDYNYSDSAWKLGAGLIAFGGNGLKIKNLAIDNSYVKAVSVSASAFIGTTGSSSSIDVGFDNCYIGKDVYIYGGCAGGFIGAGNGTGYVTGITNCYSLATIETSGKFYGAISGQVWSCLNTPAVNLYSPNVQLYGQHPMKYTDCYAVSKKENYSTETIISSDEMLSQAAMTKMIGLSDAYTLPAESYPVLKAWVNKSNDVWSGFVINTMDGDGTESSPYLISDGEGLAYAILSGGNGKYYKLTKDIYLNELNGVNWTDGVPLGVYQPSKWFENTAFYGYFDGDGHIVNGIYYPIDNGKTSAALGNAALFPIIKSNTHIINLGVKNSYIDIFGRSAAIVGFVEQSSNNKDVLIDSCFSDETVTVVHSRVNEATGVCSGGIMGGTLFTPNIKVSNCYSTAVLKGPYSYGKIIASIWMSPESVVAENCYGDGKLWGCTSEGNALKTAVNSYSTIAPNPTYTTWTQLTEAQMKGLNVFDTMPLGDAYVATEGYPVLRVFNKTPDAPEVLVGDVNGDNVIDTTDLAAIKLHLAGLNDDVKNGADMNGDGSIDTTDLAALKIYLAEN